MIKKENHNSGITLIETIIYVSLFGIVMFLSINSLYYLIENSEKNNKLSKIEAEALFINKKIDSIMDGNPNVTIQNLGRTLILEKNGLITRVINTDGDLLIYRNSTTEQKLNNEELKITDVLFEQISQSNQNYSIKIKYKIEDKEYTYNVYNKY